MNVITGDPSIFSFHNNMKKVPIDVVIFVDERWYEILFMFLGNSDSNEM